VARALLLAAALLSLGTSSCGMIDRLVFQPSPGVDLTPEQLGVEGREVYLDTEDGVRIHGFVLPAPGATRAILFASPHVSVGAGRGGSRVMPPQQRKSMAMRGGGLW